MSTSPRPHIRQLTPYKPGKTIEALKQELGLEEIIKLASNENPLGASPLVSQAIQAALPLIHLYPDGACQTLREALSEFYALPPEYFVFGNGSDEIIHLLGIAYLDPGDEVVMGDPAFIRYDACAHLNNARLHKVPLPPPTFQHDLPAMLKQVNARTKLFVLANPNNPTGTLVTKAELEWLLERLPSHVLLVLDEAYFEYADHPDYPNGIEYVRAGYNLIVLRTFSKAYGLAGLRIGYGIARPEILDPLERVREPFNVNTLAQVAACAALKDQAHVQRTRALNRQSLDYLQAECARLGLRFVPSYANFLLIEVGEEAEAIAQSLLKQGVLVRTGAVFGLPTYLRVNTGTEPHNQRFVQALERALQERRGKNLTHVP